MNVFHCSALDKKLKISPVTCMIVLHPMTLHTHTLIGYIPVMFSNKIILTLEVLLLADVQQ